MVQVVYQVTLTHDFWQGKYCHDVTPGDIITLLRYLHIRARMIKSTIQKMPTLLRHEIKSWCFFNL